MKSVKELKNEKKQIKGLDGQQRLNAQKFNQDLNVKISKAKDREFTKEYNKKTFKELIKRTKKTFHTHKLSVVNDKINDWLNSVQNQQNN